MAQVSVETDVRDKNVFQLNVEPTDTGAHSFFSKVVLIHGNEDVVSHAATIDLFVRKREEVSTHVQSAFVLILLLNS